MKNSGNQQFNSALAGERQMYSLSTDGAGNVIVPNNKQSSKSESVQSDERVLKGRGGVLGFFLKILLPNSITTTPPPYRQVFY